MLHHCPRTFAAVSSPRLQQSKFTFALCWTLWPFVADRDEWSGALSAAFCTCSFLDVCTIWQVCVHAHRHSHTNLKFSGHSDGVSLCSLHNKIWLVQEPHNTSSQLTVVEKDKFSVQLRKWKEQTMKHQCLKPSPVQQEKVGQTEFHPFTQWTHPHTQQFLTAPEWKGTEPSEDWCLGICSTRAFRFAWHLFN